MQRKIINYYLWILISLFFSTSFWAQEKIKFGKVDIADLEMTSYPEDENASAVILSDICHVRIIYENVDKRSFKFQIERHRRVKILGPNGLNWADVSIPLHRNKKEGYKEEITTLKGITHNLENGEVSQIKLDKKQVFTTEIDKNNEYKGFAFPGVKKGSIIEYKYVIHSDFLYKLDDWFFQSTIPTHWSEIKLEIPEYFKYNMTFRGYEFGDLVINDQLSKLGDFKSTDPKGVSRQNFTVNIYHWGAKNIPAFIEEAFIINKEIHLGRIEFELSAYYIPGVSLQNLNNDWSSVNTVMLRDEDFGLQLKKTSFLKDIAVNLTKDLSHPKDKVTEIYHHIRNSIDWNGKYKLYVTNGLRKTYEDQLGYSSDINFLLINMLNAIEINTYPLMVSTRANGFINPAHPSIHQFNHVIAAVTINGEYWLLDATEPLIPSWLLPLNSLNGKGRLVHPSNHTWLDLRPYI